MPSERAGAPTPASSAEGGEPVVSLAGEVTDACFRDAGRPADEGAGADAAFPDVALDAIEGAEGVEEVGAVALWEVGLFAGAVVGGEDDEGVVVDVESPWRCLRRSPTQSSMRRTLVA